jgi:predicted SprT family Zn-dependent metalloprotease
MADASNAEATLSERAAPHLERWGALWGVPGLARTLRVVASGRMRTSLGLYRPGRGEIRVARFLLAGPEALLLEVLCHEAAHAVVYARHGRSVRPHGREWRALMEAAGHPGRARLPEARLAELPAAARRQRFLFAHRCPACGRERLAGRPVRGWRCVPCARTGGTGRLVVSRRAMSDAPHPGPA